MPIVGHQAHSFWGWGADTGFTGSITINIAPAYISAQVGYHMLSGEGLHKIGIKKYRQRPTTDGPEQEVDFGSWPNWPHTIGANRVTSVTFGITLGAHQEAHCYGNLFWWG
jgi:hypothetical protein